MKNFIHLFFALLLLGNTNILQAQDFITKWKFDNATTALMLGVQTTAAGASYTWTASPSGNNGSGTITKVTAGVLTISGLNIVAGDTMTLSISPTHLRRVYFDYTTNRINLIDVAQWGAVQWSSMESGFNGCGNLNISASDVPNLSDVTNMGSMFSGCTKLNSPTNINTWNVSNAQNMSSLFFNCPVFNQPIGSWNTGNVTNMSSMFCRAKLFNQPIGTWNTSNVRDMSFMFQIAEKFNQPIGTWNTGSVTNMASLFNFSYDFDQPLNSWNTENVTNMSRMFSVAKVFNQPLDNWNTGNVTTMVAMFGGAYMFNQPIGNWNTGNVKEIGDMFNEATSFNQPIESWDMSQVTYSAGMFAFAAGFNQPLNDWDMSAATNIGYMFAYATSFNQPLNNWNISNATLTNGLFWNATSFNQNIGDWTLNSDINLSYFLRFCGMDYCNYSATLKGWAANNPTVTGRTLDANGLQYTSEVGNNERAALVNNLGWTIDGDNEVVFSPYLMPDNQMATGIFKCIDGAYLKSATSTDKILEINANGNLGFDYTTAAISVSNQFVSSLPGGVTTQSAGYYEMSNGLDALRVSRRLHIIQQPGNYNVNGGVIVRVYYSSAEIGNILNSATLPSGSHPIAQQGWFKSSGHTVSDVVNDMGIAVLNNSQQIFPFRTGNENGVEYADFLLSSFSTIGYFASTAPTILPVELIQFDIEKQGEDAQLIWSTASEKNNDRFEIEHSLNGITFEQVGTVHGNGTTALPHTYSYTHQNPGFGTHYYRLRQVDYDGANEYSPIRSVAFDLNNEFSFYPNPATGSITMNSRRKIELLQIIDMNGKIVKQVNAIQDQGNTDISSLPPGIYVINCHIAGELITRKLIKK